MKSVWVIQIVQSKVDGNYWHTVAVADSFASAVKHLKESSVGVDMVWEEPEGFGRENWYLTARFHDGPEWRYCFTEFLVEGGK
jgi:hypothetical protein